MKPAQRHPAIASGFIACAMVLGGGGSPNPLTEIMLQLLAVVAALAWLWLPGAQGQPSLAEGRAPWLLTALVLLLPFVQLIPLPAGVWSFLPGQQDRAASLALVDGVGRWHPLTHSPSRTLASLLALFPPLFALLATASLDSRGRAKIIMTIAVVACLAALFGGVQVSLGTAAPRLYAESNSGLTGFQANKNAAADILLIGAVAAAVALSPSPGRQREVAPVLIADRKAAWMLLGGVLAVLLVATLLTNSRAGILLIPLALVGCSAILASGGALRGRLRWEPALALALGVALAGFGLMAQGSHVLGPVFARFAAQDDFRRQLWRDGWFALRRSWPDGIGLGGAQPALIAAERLEVVGLGVPNRVHNDYIEFVLEGGILAVVILAALAVLVTGMAARAWRQRADDRPQIALGVTIVLLVACHSLVDYPLRSMALASLMGVAAGLLLAPPARRDVAARGEAAA